MAKEIHNCKERKEERDENYIKVFFFLTLQHTGVAWSVL